MHFKALALASFVSAAAGQSLTEALESNPNLSNLTTYLNLFPDFQEQLAGMTDITLLAPSDAAFAGTLANDSLTELTANEDMITSLFSYHVLNGTYSNFSIMPEFIVTALMQGPYSNVTGGQAVEVIASSNSTNATVSFFSGLLQESMIIPPGSTNSSSGSGNGTTFDGGIIYVIDQFLVVPENITNTAVQLNLRSAVGALGAADLDTSVNGLTDVTCFIPDNEAFQAVGATIATSSDADLARIMQYHIVNGTVGYSSTLTNGTTLTTLNGIDVTITESDGNIFVNSARVITPNVLVANGVIHVIDGVLNPGNMTASADPTATSQEPAFSGASAATDAPFTSGVTSATTSVNTEAPTSIASAAAGTSEAKAPVQTGAIGAAALFGGAAIMMNM